ncbi:MAG: hypothetical protein AAF402_09320 [Pseudomonadota bacterium]
MSKDKPVSKHQSSEQRRAALKKVLTGGVALGLGGVTTQPWVKPAVQSVILPAHATTTGAGGDEGEGSDPTGPWFQTLDLPGPQSEQTIDRNLPEKFADLLISPVHANHLAGPLVVQICVTRISDTLADVQLRWQANTNFLEGEPIEFEDSDAESSAPKGNLIRPSVSSAWRGNVPVGGNANLGLDMVAGSCNAGDSCNVSITAFGNTVAGSYSFEIDGRFLEVGRFNAPEAACNFNRLICDDIG